MVDYAGSEGDGWLYGCEKTETILNEGLEIAHRIVGPRDEAENTAKATDCSADSLDVGLAILQSRAQALVDELKRVAMKF